MTREEAIERIRQRINGMSWCIDDEDKDAITTLVPELAESEDERTRKELVSYLTDIVDNISSEEIIPHDAKILGGKIRHWIAYLEKQKEQKGLQKNPKFKVGDRIRTLEKDDEGIGPMYEDEIVSIGDDGSYKLKHLGELYLPESEWELVEKYKAEEKKEQKPAEWSKLDELKLDRICYHLTDHCDRIGEFYTADLVSWLKSLRPQPKQEWSEEDEEELQNAIDCLEYLGNGGVYASESGYDAAKNAAKWLRSLYP